MEMSVPAWEVRRSRINHDRLKNIYYRGINAFILRVESDDPDKTRVERFVESDFHTWTDYNPLITRLMRDYENEMSPRTFFDEPPLNRCDADTKGWLGNLVHELWIDRYNVKKTIKTAESALEAGDLLYAGLNDKLKRTDLGNILELKKLLQDFRDFRKACGELKGAERRRARKTASPRDAVFEVHAGHPAGAVRTV